MTSIGEEIEGAVELRPLQFDFTRVPNPTILLVAKRDSGKTYTTVSIADKFKHIGRGAAFCGTKSAEFQWSERFGSRCTVKGLKEEGRKYLTELVSYQEEKVEKYKYLKKKFPQKYEIGLIFDDMTSDRKFAKSEQLEKLLSNGRHYHALIIICAQYLKQLPPPVRSNLDYVFILNSTKMVLELLYKEYIQESEISIFFQLYKTVTRLKREDGTKMFSSLVFNNTGAKNGGSLSDIFQIYFPESREY